MTTDEDITLQERIDELEKRLPTENEATASVGWASQTHSVAKDAIKLLREVNE